MSLDRDAPVARAVQPPSGGRVVALARVGGLQPPLLQGSVTCRTSFSPRQDVRREGAAPNLSRRPNLGGNERASRYALASMGYGGQ